jgi:hypothetical protein
MDEYHRFQELTIQDPDQLEIDVEYLSSNSLSMDDLEKVSIQFSGINTDEEILKGLAS